LSQETGIKKQKEQLEVLLSEIQKGKSVIFSNVSSGITGSAKEKKWEATTSAVDL